MVNKNWDIFVCGLNCARCDLKEKDECRGCRGHQDHHWSPDCKFLPCATSKRLKHCFECDELPCEMLEAFSEEGHDHHRMTVENLIKIKKIGLQEWIDHRKR